MFDVRHFNGYVVWLTLIGFVYGCYGLLIGSLVDGELEGILLIVLLANIDVGWLQNPIFYADSHNKEIIRYLPGYYPSQSAIISAATDYSATAARHMSLMYGSMVLLLSMLIFYIKMKVRT